MLSQADMDHILTTLQREYVRCESGFEWTGLIPTLVIRQYDQVGHLRTEERNTIPACAWVYKSLAMWNSDGSFVGRNTRFFGRCYFEDGQK